MPSHRTHHTGRTSGAGHSSSSARSSRRVNEDQDDTGRPTAPPQSSTALPRSAGARPIDPRWSRCRSCRLAFVAASLVAGECPACAGLQALPLRGEGGKFLPGLTHGPTPSPSRPITTGRLNGPTRDDVR